MRNIKIVTLRECGGLRLRILPSDLGACSACSRIQVVIIQEFGVLQHSNLVIVEFQIQFPPESNDEFVFCDETIAGVSKKVYANSYKYLYV